MKVYAILIQSEEDGVKLLPNYFGTYKKAVDEVKILYPEWDDRYDEDDGSLKEYPTINKVEVEEGHKMDGTRGDPNLTELYIERGIYIYIRILVKNPKETFPPAAGGGYGYTRRRQSKRNNKNTRKT
jgi:hypothetical protein